MPHRLHIHPDATSDAIERLVFDVRSDGGHRLAFVYRLDGEINRLNLDGCKSDGTQPDLWTSTCFEVFLAARPSDRYVEFNFAPDGRWAAYSFRDKRFGKRSVRRIASPRIGIQDNAESFELTAHVDLTGLGFLTRARRWLLAPAAVIEDQRGELSYWAARHPAGRPNFHHDDCYAVEMKAGKRR